MRRQTNLFIVTDWRRRKRARRAAAFRSWWEHYRSCALCLCRELNAGLPCRRGPVALKQMTCEEGIEIRKAWYQAEGIKSPSGQHPHIPSPAPTARLTRRGKK